MNSPTTPNRRRPAALAALLFPLAAAAPASQPASRPATGDLVALGNDLVRFYAPPSPDWAISPSNPASADRIRFAKADHQSLMEFELTSVNYPLGQVPAAQVATSVVKALKDQRKKQGYALVLPPTVEHDKRFDVLVHEQYQINADVTVDSLHLLKVVGPRTVMVVVSCGAADPAVVTAAHAAAEAALASAKYNRKAIAPGRTGGTPSRR